MHRTTYIPIFITTFAAFLLPINASKYTLTDNWEGASFLAEFIHEPIQDPTHGRVQYVNEVEALRLNLTYTTPHSSPDPHIILRADSKEKLNPWGPGRKSVRVMSKKSFGHGTVLVADVLHMPEGCGTWPALWSTDALTWPNKGEIDIIEGVNDQSANHVTLHTTSNCKMQRNRDHTGEEQAQNCDWQVNWNTGCGVKVDKKNSFGPGFNAHGGGIYAMERTATEIKAWFWPRNEQIPFDVKTMRQKEINTAEWGRPVARFPTSSECSIREKFAEEHIVINLTFCGDWAGNVYGPPCPLNCNAFVEQNPEAFINAYWDFRAIRMYASQDIDPPFDLPSLDSSPIDTLPDLYPVVNIPGNILEGVVNGLGSALGLSRRVKIAKTL